MTAGHGLYSLRTKGQVPLTTYLRRRKIGDDVGVKVNGAVPKGMPCKFYHGQNGRPWDATNRAAGVEINDQATNFPRWKSQLGTKYAQFQIVNALRLGERERAFELLANLGDANDSVGPDDFSFVLDYCAKTPDPLFVMETWRIMVEKAVALDARCCRYILKAFSEGGYLEEAFNWLTFVGESDFAHSVLPLYNTFLSGVSRQSIVDADRGSRQSFIDVDHCVELMENRLVGKSEITYWQRLKYAVLRKNLSAVHDIWKECTKFYTPTIITLRKFIWSFTRLNAVESAYAVLQHMVKVAPQESTSIRITSRGRYHPSRLDIPIPSYSELPHKIFESGGMEHSPNILPAARIESVDVKVGNMYRFNEENRTFHNGDHGLMLGSLLQEPLHVGRSHGTLTEDITGSQIFPSSSPSEVDTRCLEHEEFVQPNLENRRQKALGSRVLQARLAPSVKNILRWSFNNVIHACAQTENCELAEQLFMQMRDLGVEPSGDTYDGFVKAVLHGKGATYAMTVIKYMEKRNIMPYNDTFAALSTGHSKILELDVAEVLLENISDSLPKYVHPFNAFLAACDVTDQPDRAIRVLAKMRHLKIKSNIRTYELLFSLFGNINVPYEEGNMFSQADVSKRITVIERDMIRSGLQHSYTTMKNLIRALGAEGMIHEMLWYLNRAESMLNIDPYEKSEIYNIVLHALVKAKDSSTAIDLFKNMRSCGFPVNMATYNMMIECCSILACFKSASALLSMMLRDGFVPKTSTYDALIKVLLARDEFDNAVSLLDQTISEGIQLDILIFNTILREACSKGRIDIIELIIEFIHREKIHPDPSTCWYAFSVYVDLGFHSTAMEALQVMSMRMISEDDSTLQQHMAAYEDLIYSEDPDIESKIIEIFEESQESTATALLSLRWCAISGLNLLSSPMESLWAKRLSSSYDAINKDAI